MLQIDQQTIKTLFPFASMQFAEDFSGEVTQLYRAHFENPVVDQAIAFRTTCVYGLE